MSQPILNQRYRIEAKLGEGSFGEVYRATDLQTEEPVAIKTIGKAVLQNEDQRKRFTREVAALRRLKHPNIIGYIDAFTRGERAFLVMEYVGGGTLENVIKRQAPLQEAVFRQMALKILDAVATAHEDGIIHRDLKPANILMNAVGEPKIADFGLARLSDFSTMTATDTMMGTLAYMPPEAFDALSRQDHRGDVWALGIILYEMLTRLLPFRGNTQTQIIAGILHEAPVHLDTVRRDLPASWSSIIMHCLEKDASQRYQTTRQLYEDLRGERFTGRMVAALEDFGDDDDIIFDDNFFDEALSGQRGVVVVDSDDALAVNTVTMDGRATMPQSQKTPRYGEYGLHFISGDVANVAPPAPGGEPARARYLAKEDNEPLVQPLKVPMPVMLIGGSFLWVGISLVLLSAVLFVIYFLPNTESFRVPGNILVGLQAIGAFTFMIGIGFEFAYAQRTNERILYAILVPGAFFTWLIFFSELLIDRDFLVAVIGMLLYLIIIIGYFSAKSV